MSDTSDPLQARVADFFWSRVPSEASRLSRTLGVILRDGDVLLVRPEAAAAAPPVALVLGLVLGTAHPGDTYTYSVLVLAILAAIAGLGAGPGFWALTGFVVGDLLLHRREAFYGRDLGDNLAAYAAQLISYAVLAGLLVIAPVASVALRLRAANALARFVPQARQVALVLQVVLQTFYAFLWAQSAAFLIRPIWSFRDTSPTTSAISPLQNEWWALATATALTASVRAYLTLRVGTVRRARARPTRRRGLTIRVPQYLSIALKALFLTALISGLISGVIEAVVVYVLIAVALAVREIVMPRAGNIVQWIRRVPLLVRLVLTGIVAYLLASVIVEPATRSTSSFDSLLATIILSFFASAVLLPGAMRGTQR